MRLTCRILFSITIICQSLLLSSCSSLAYYGQSISGQLQLLRAQRDFASIYADPAVADALKQRLRRISQIRDFASESLSLPDNNSYRSYADLGRPYVVWNVFATPRLSLEPHQSCFLVVGCLDYRGYFSKDDAIRYMRELEQREYDVYLGGVSAYSTLGWFNDPVLGGMLERTDLELARLIFHELAHQRLYIPNDTDFNEAFAEALARIGVELWLVRQADVVQKQEFTATLTRETEFHTLVLSYRDRLSSLYQSNSSRQQKLMEKQHIFTELRQDYQKLRASWGNITDYDNWFANANNARIAAVATYQSLVPEFLELFTKQGENLESFYNQMDAIAACPAPRRRQLLRAGVSIHNCKPGE